MKQHFVFLLATLFLAACQNDASMKRDFSGSYKVSIQSRDAAKEMKKAKKDVEKDIEKAKEEIREDIEKAKEDIRKELGEDSQLGESISTFVEGMGKFAENMTDLGKEMSHLGIDIGTDVISGLKFNAEFMDNGKVQFGSNNSSIRINGSSDLRWEIKDGKFYLWDNDDHDKEPFEMKKINDDEWELIGEDVIFRLEKR